MTETTECEIKTRQGMAIKAPPTRQERFMELLEPVRDNLSRFVQTLERNREDARDIVCEAVLVAYEQFDSLDNERAFLSWMFTITRRVFYRKYAKKRIFRLFGSAETAEALETADTGLQPDEAADLLLLSEALDRLPPKQREALALSDIFGFDLKEICAVQGDGLSAVKQRVRRARAKLRSLLAERPFAERPTTTDK